MSTQLPGPVSCGTDSYYRDRRDDFLMRCPDATPPAYYEEYGDKCLHQFRQTEPDLTARGRVWLQATLVSLQAQMEDLRESAPAAFAELEHDSEAFSDAAFEMHSNAYIESGIAELPVSDLWKIARTPDVSDLLTADGVKEIVEVLQGVADGNGQTGTRRSGWACLTGVCILLALACRRRLAGHAAITRN
mgnify:CR=1 FL=1